MQAKRSSLVVFALLLGVLFLGAQLHFCADFAPGPTGTHLCPVCSAAASAAVASGPVIALVPVLRALELSDVAILLPADSSVPVSPRAPPVL